jgi:outer membrane protein assembly factor BamD
MTKWGGALACLAALALFGCASAPLDEEVPSAEAYYARALEILEGRRVLLFFHDVDYDKAIELLQEVIDNYPYSEHATQAELKIADIHFDRGRYEEATSYYQDFVELHPNHPSVPYAVFRNGESSFRRIRAPDQDQSATRDAIAQYQVLLERYPSFEQGDLAREHLHAAENNLALYEIGVGDFYYERGNFHAAARRYREALSLYPLHDDRVRTMARLGVSLSRTQQSYEAERLLRQVLNLEPDDEVLALVERELEDLQAEAGGQRGLPRSCVTDPNPACAKSEPAGDAPPPQ